MERNSELLAKNIMAKAIGTLAGGIIFALFFSDGMNERSPAWIVMFVAGFCALGYMIGNMLSVFASYSKVKQPAEKEKNNDN